MEVQRRLAAAVAQTPSVSRFRLVAGLDAAFSPDGHTCLAGVVLWDRRRKEVIEEHVVRRAVHFPYIPGLLSFREVPALLQALRRLRQVPDVLMCDGQGWAHPRRLGIACHVGLICNLPAVGCAKSRLLGTHGVVPDRHGARVALYDRGEVVGEVVRTRVGCNPLFVSVGHRVTLAQARNLVLSCVTRFRLPEPTRLADRLVARARDGLKGTG